MSRYLRHDLIDWFDQQLLKSTKALVIGAGAIGNEVVKNLALLGVGAITIVDFDSIELHNLTRCVLYTENDVGKPKAEVAAEAARRLDPNCRVSSIVGDFWETITFDEFRSSTVVFSCLDNFDSRIRLNRICSLLGVDLVNAGIDSRYVSAEFYPFARNPDSSCYECNLPPTVYQRVGERYSCGWLRKRAYEERKVPTTAITASHAGAMSTSMFLYSFRPDVECSSRRLFLDTLTLASSTTELPRAELCPCCNSESRAIVVRAGRKLGGMLFERLSPEVSVSLSEQILVGWAFPNCVLCKDRREIVLAPASKFTDTDAKCAECGLMQGLADIRDQFTFTELQEFVGRDLPGKFATIEVDGKKLVIELMQGGCDE